MAAHGGSQFFDEIKDARWAGKWIEPHSDGLWWSEHGTDAAYLTAEEQERLMGFDDYMA